MGELSTLAKARRELEDLYSGIPDESVNLTFQDFAQLCDQQQQQQQHHHHHPVITTATNAAAAAATTSARKKSGLSPISEAATLTKLPSLDFNRAFEASNSYSNSRHHQHNNHHHPVKDHFHDSIMDMPNSSMNHYGQHHRMDDHLEELALHGHGSRGSKDPYHGNHHGHHRQQQHLGFSSSSMGFDDISSHTGPVPMDPFQAHNASAATAGGGRRRPGIPHSNICTICSVSTYMFRHRCLVCGRVYCRQCVAIGMGEMTEGRKCIECLGKRFSQRYIEKAGKVGCCMGYPTSAKLQELKWAEMGPRRSGQNRYGGGRSGMRSRSRSPMTPTTPTSAHITSHSAPPSFVATSPYSPANYHLPL